MTTLDLNLIQSVNTDYSVEFLGETFIKNIIGCIVVIPVTLCFASLVYSMGGDSPWEKSGFTDLNHLMLCAKKRRNKKSSKFILKVVYR